jgi:3D (Asp-Asp-Asp) domain-containing protein
VAGETVPAQGSTEAAQDLVLEGEALDGSLNRRDTETGSTGDLFWLTTYTCEEGYCGFTANNVQVAEYTLEGYRMAACSEHWAFGTRFLVAGRWLVECQDRGSGVVLPNHLDVYFPTAKEAAAWLAQVGDHARVEVRP